MTGHHSGIFQGVPFLEPPVKLKLGVPAALLDKFNIPTEDLRAILSKANTETFLQRLSDALETLSGSELLLHTLPFLHEGQEVTFCD